MAPNNNTSSTQQNADGDLSPSPPSGDDIDDASYTPSQHSCFDYLNSISKNNTEGTAVNQQLTQDSISSEGTPLKLYFSKQMLASQGIKVGRKIDPPTQDSSTWSIQSARDELKKNMFNFFNKKKSPPAIPTHLNCLGPNSTNEAATTSNIPSLAPYEHPTEPPQVSFPYPPQSHYNPSWDYTVDNTRPTISFGAGPRKPSPPPTTPPTKMPSKNSKSSGPAIVTPASNNQQKKTNKKLKTSPTTKKAKRSYKCAPPGAAKKKGATKPKEEEDDGLQQSTLTQQCRKHGTVKLPHNDEAVSQGMYLLLVHLIQNFKLKKKQMNIYLPSLSISIYLLSFLFEFFYSLKNSKTICHHQADKNGIRR